MSLIAFPLPFPLLLADGRPHEWGERDWRRARSASCASRAPGRLEGRLGPAMGSE